jgi:hypothetical protein
MDKNKKRRKREVPVVLIEITFDKGVKIYSYAA